MKCVDLGTVDILAFLKIASYFGLSQLLGGVKDHLGEGDVIVRGDDAGVI